MYLCTQWGGVFSQLGARQVYGCLMIVLCWLCHRWWLLQTQRFIWNTSISSERDETVLEANLSKWWSTRAKCGRLKILRSWFASKWRNCVFFVTSVPHKQHQQQQTLFLSNEKQKSGWFQRPGVWSANKHKPLQTHTGRKHKAGRTPAQTANSKKYTKMHKITSQKWKIVEFVLPCTFVFRQCLQTARHG